MVLVTGTSTGLGIAVAVQAAHAGHTVYATMRNLDKRGALDAAAEQAGVSLHVLPLDVQDAHSIADAVDRVIADQGRIGVHFTVVEPGGIATEFATNVLAHVEQTGGVLDDEYRPILERYIGGAQSRADGSDIYQTADQVAEVVMTALAAETPPLRLRTSNWGESFTALKTGLDPDGRKLTQQVFDQFLA